MKLIVKARDKTSLLFELPEEDHTFSRLLNSTLHEIDTVDAAAYRVPHPLLATPEFKLKVKKGKPKDALLQAAEKMKQQVTSFREAFKKAIG